ncbi:MAG: hypothetical protein WCO56_15195 [Verrucomicrobiota bacterium]
MKQLVTLLWLTLLVTGMLLGGESSIVAGVGTNDPALKARAALLEKASSIKLPEFRLAGATLAEAALKLEEASKQHDANHKKVNCILDVPAKALSGPKITLHLKNVTFAEAVERVAQSASVRFSAEAYAFVFWGPGNHD